MHRVAHLHRSRALVFHKDGFQQRHRLGFLRREAHHQESLRLATAHREDAVRRDTRRRLAPVEVVLKLRAFLFLARDHLRPHDALLRIKCPHPRARICIFRDALRDDVARAGQRVIQRERALLLINLPLAPRVLLRRSLHVERDILRPEQIRERLQPLLLRRRRARALLLPERRIQIFEHIHRLRRADFFQQVRGEQLPLIERLHDAIAALVEFLELLQSVADVHNLHLIQLARALLAIPRDERHRAALLQQHSGRGDLSRLNGKFRGDLEDVLFEHVR